MKALLIEDSRLARKELRNMLIAFPQIEIIGEAADGEEAVVQIEQLQPDLLFLDIQLPGKSGFEVLESLDAVPHVIFTTAFDEYAIRSFEYNTIDYLLKPIHEDRLAKAIDKLPQLGSTSSKRNQLGLEDRIFVKDGEQCWFVYLREIRLIESMGNYTRLYFGKHQPLIQKSLNYLEDMLDSDSFFRINRQQIINLKEIEGVASWFNGKLRLRLKSGEEVEVSRRQSNKLKAWFSL